MPAWLVRGLVLAAVYAAAAVGVAWADVFHRDAMTVVTSVVFAAMLGVALTWGAIDGWARRPHRGTTWLYAALTAGPLAGIAYVIGRAVFVDQTGVSALGVQLTSGAAFFVLLVIVPAWVGQVVGRRVSPDPADRTPEADGDAAARR
ncbi:B-4DMT family transporter [Haloechinothrix salitolerans]|uniref:B-4DMT family transporter n=1 Tax=Haloechinothrix salitolerans TaxID=926830 RepID=A0ABW2C1Z8_9PSEU